MTFEEKKNLSSSINSLSPDHLRKVVQIITTQMPELAQSFSSDIEIEIESLNTATLRALERFVKSCNSTQSKSKKNKKPKLTEIEKKLLQAEITSQTTDKNIQTVKEKLMVNKN